VCADVPFGARKEDVAPLGGGACTKVFCCAKTAEKMSKNIPVRM